MLEFLVCPDCEQSLTVQVVRETGMEIEEGTLACSSGHTFRISAGIPRFVPEQSYAGSFGFQWNKFSRVQLDSFNGTSESLETLLEKTGFSPEAMKGSLVLDAGVGAGRFTDVASGLGAEVVGVDLSSAVDAAYRNLGDRPNVHLLQADIFHLPFRRNSFDFVFSIGVIHHTPDAAAAFRNLAPLLKENGQIAIWVYDRYTEFRRITDPIRMLTTRMPRNFVYFMSTIAVPLYYLKPFRTILQGVFRLCMHKNWRWRWLDTFDYYTPKYQSKHTYPEVFAWFQQAGLTDITPLSAPVSMKGTKRCSTTQS